MKITKKDIEENRKGVVSISVRLEASIAEKLTLQAAELNVSRNSLISVILTKVV